MVSAGIANTLMSTVDSGTKISANKKSDKSGKDFTQILENQSDVKSYDKKENVVRSEKTTENMSNSDETKEIIQNNYSEEITETEEMSEEKPETDVEMSEALAMMIKDIMNIIADKLNVSENQVVSAVEELGISASELVDSASINEIICKLTGMEGTMDILTNTELSGITRDIHNEIGKLLSEFKESFSVKDEAELKSMLSEAVFLQNEPDDLSSGENHMDEAKVEINAELKVNEEVSGNADNESGLLGQDNSSKQGINAKKDDEDSKAALSNEGLTGIFENIKSTLTEQLGIEDESVSDRIIRQITDSIKFSVNSETKSLEIQLNPESLGKVNVTVTSKAGVVTAHMVVQNDIAKEAVESQIAQLKENFVNQGLKVEAVEVTVASKEFEQNLDKGNHSSSEEHSGKRRRHISEEEMAEINGIGTLKEEKEEIIKELSNATVSYMA